MDYPQDPKGASLIFVQCALEEADHLDRLHKIYRRYKTESSASDALWSGCCALRNVRDDSVRHVLRRGQILFCFPGTTALQQPAAGPAA